MLGNLIECEHFSPQNNGCISESLTQCWTLQAIECWQVQQKCSACSIGMANYSFECQMGKVVKELLKKFGPPGPEDYSYCGIEKTA